MKRHMFLAAALWGCLAVNATDKQFTSPDGRLQVTVSDDAGKPAYQITYDGVTFLEKSPLGLITNIGDYSQNMTLSEEMKQSSIDERYSLNTIKQRDVHYTATEAVCPFVRDGKVIYDVIFRVSNRDVAFRYKMYPQRNTLCCVIDAEATGFSLPEGTTTFLCPQSKPMGGFARTSPSYETGYTVDDAMGKMDGVKVIVSPVCSVMLIRGGC